MKRLFRISRLLVLYTIAALLCAVDGRRWSLIIPRGMIPTDRRVAMDATALNGRDLGGVHCSGFLGRPTVSMLVG